MSSKPVSKLDSLLSWLGLPIYIWQGLAVRRRSIRLEPPRCEGWVLRGEAFSGEALRILLIGDSSAAGVGAKSMERSLGGFLPEILATKLQRPIEVRIAGNNSATAGQIRDYVVPNLARENYDYICINIGTNDAKNFQSGRRFCKAFGTLLYALKAKWPGAQIIWAGVLDLEAVPALPSPLNKILGIRSRIIDRNGRILCRERGALSPVSDWNPTADNFAVDGFHASEKGYREWAESLSEFIGDLEQAE